LGQRTEKDSCATWAGGMLGNSEKEQERIDNSYVSGKERIRISQVSREFVVDVIKIAYGGYTKLHSCRVTSMITGNSRRK
jgi:hypothetical protein